jgi:hypothetical protein
MGASAEAHRSYADLFAEFKNFEPPDDADGLPHQSLRALGLRGGPGAPNLPFMPPCGVMDRRGLGDDLEGARCDWHIWCA